MSDIRGDVVFGQIDRISGAGNAMLSVSDTEYNLGSLPQSVAGENVVALVIDGTWALCLTEDAISEDYIENFLSEREIDDLDSMEMRAADGYRTPPTAVTQGDKIDISKIISRYPGVLFGIANQTVVRVETPGVDLIDRSEISAVVTQRQEAHIDAKLDIDQTADQTLSPGDVVDVSVLAHRRGDTVGVYEGLPTIVKDVQYAKDKQVKLGLSEVEDGYLVADFEQLPDEERPSIGEKIAVAEPNVPGHNIIERLPIEIQSRPKAEVDTTRIQITGYTEDTIIAIPDLVNADEFELGEEVSFEIKETTSGTLEGAIDDAPIILPHEIEVLGGFEGREMRAGVAEIHPDHVEVRIDSLPTLPASGSKFEVDIIESSRNKTLGVAEKCPVVIPGTLPADIDPIQVGVEEATASHLRGSVTCIDSEQRLGKGATVRLTPTSGSDVTVLNGTPVGYPSSLPVGEQVKLGISDIQPEMAVAEISALPDEALPDVDATVEATVVDATCQDTIAVADGIPILLPVFEFEPGTEVKILICDIQARWVVGLTTRVLTDDEAFDLGQYLRATHTGAKAIREGDYPTASSRFEEAAAIVDSYSTKRTIGTRQAELLAGTISLLQENSPDAAAERVDEILASVPNLNDTTDRISMAYLHEIDATEMLLKAIRDKPSGPFSSDLQKIAQETESRKSVEQAAKKLNSANQAVSDRALEEAFPTPLMKALLKVVSEEYSIELRSLGKWEESTDTLSAFVWPDHLRIEYDIDNHDEDIPTKYESNLKQDLVGGEGHQEESQGKDSTSENSTASPQTPASDQIEEVTEPDENGAESEVGGTSSEKQERIKSSPETSASASKSTTQDDSQTDEGGESNVGDERVSEKAIVTEFEQSDIQNESELDQLRQQAERSASENPVRDTSSSGGSRYQRSQAVRRYALSRAGGTCECCGGSAPFETEGGRPYLEVHHVDELGEGGADRPDKVVALCPTCHKRIHHGKDGNRINERLREKLNSGLADVGL